MGGEESSASLIATEKQTCQNRSLFALHLSCLSGHLLGLSHDDSKFCEENFGSTEDKRLMSSILTSIDASKPWSKCTSATITEFLDDGHGRYSSTGSEAKPHCTLLVFTLPSKTMVAETVSEKGTRGSVYWYGMPTSLVAL